MKKIDIHKIVFDDVGLCFLLKRLNVETCSKTGSEVDICFEDRQREQQEDEQNS
jgi:hypothetical protein